MYLSSTVEEIAKLGLLSEKHGRSRFVTLFLYFRSAHSD